MNMKIFFVLMAAVALLASPATASERFTGPWDLSHLRKAPHADWGQRSNLLQQVFYEGEPAGGKPTRVFGWLGRPEKGQGPFPAMVLVHGGGGTAFPEWAKHWAERGYVALAMDLAGHGPDGRLPDGGPDQSDQVKFRDFSQDEVREMWTYHAVAAVIRGCSLLAEQKEVDRGRLGITGISWGGYLTCIVAGLDDRLKVAAPVYGCGFLHENSYWLEILSKMNPQSRTLWIENFDPSKYLAGVNCPILFLNGSNDFAYPMDSYRKTYRSVSGPMTLSLKVRLPHGHIWTFGEVDAFVDSVLRGGEPLPRLKPMVIGQGVATADASSKLSLTNAEFHFTADEGPWQKRLWKTTGAKLEKGAIMASLPVERPIVCFLSVTDERGLSVSTPHEELAKPAAR